MKNSLRATLKRGSMAGVATAGAAALLLTGCGAAPDAGSSATQTASNYTGCIVSDSGGFDDQSFNQSSYEGLKKAEKDLGIKVNQVESKTNNDFEPNLRAMVTAGCNLTVTVGFLLGDATKAQATANPDSHFAIIDFGYDTPIGNVKPIIYDTAQAAFLAGYLAAGTTKTGTVATFGGIKIPTVTIFMDGYADGVKYYNEQKGKNVKVLGWDKASPGRHLHRRLRKAGQGQAAHPELPGPGRGHRDARGRSGRQGRRRGPDGSQGSRQGRQAHLGRLRRLPHGTGLQGHHALLRHEADGRGR